MTWRSLASRVAMTHEADKRRISIVVVHTLKVPLGALPVDLVPDPNRVGTDSTGCSFRKSSSAS